MSEEFKMLGKLVATSIVQGGPGLPIFMPAAYCYIICECDYLKKIEDVPDLHMRSLICQVRSDVLKKVQSLANCTSPCC